MECVYDQAALVERCGYWRGRLRLLDWEVKPTIERAVAFGDPPQAMGEITIFGEHKRAHLFVIDPVDWQPGEDWSTTELDHEYIIVHELLHLHLWKNEAVTGEQIDTHDFVDEVTVYQLAHSLVTLDRELKEARLENGLRVDVCPGFLDVEDDTHGDRHDSCGDRSVPEPADAAGGAVLDGGRGAGDDVSAGLALERGRAAAPGDRRKPRG